MAENQKPSTTKKTSTPVVESVTKVEEPMISLSSADLQNILSGAVSAALKSVNENKQTAPASVKGVPTVAMQQRLAEEQRRFTASHHKMAADKKGFVAVEIPTIYQKYMGKFQTLNYNGSTVKVPIDGKRYWIHKNFLPMLNEKLRHISNKASRESRYDEQYKTQGDIEKVSLSK